MLIEKDKILIIRVDKFIVWISAYADAHWWSLIRGINLENFHSHQKEKRRFLNVCLVLCEISCTFVEDVKK